MFFKALLCHLFAINFVDIASCFAMLAAARNDKHFVLLCAARWREVPFQKRNPAWATSLGALSSVPNGAEIFLPRTKRLSLCLSDGGCTREKTRWNFGRRLKSSVALPRCGIKKKYILRGPRERCRSVPRGGVKKIWSVADREQCYSVTHRDFEETNMIGRGPREQCRSVPRGSVKKELSLADRESCVTLYRGVAFKEVTLCRRIAFFFKKKGIGHSRGPRE